MKSPNWHRDEIILALDLYYSLEPKEMDNKNPKIIQLSEFLNILPIHNARFHNHKFRNPNGVGLKLSNFKAIDPDFTGKGMDRFSKQDKEIFFEFKEKINELKSIANQIKNTVSNNEINQKLYTVTNEDDDEVNCAKEGRVIYKLHKLRERGSKLSKKKKEEYFKQNGKLDCEICGFDFVKKYGEIGKGFMEAHHIIPLSKINGETQTELNDLALVCANCHRMLHREISTMNIESLKNKLK